jgi:hypothetical protein
MPTARDGGWVGKALQSVKARGALDRELREPTGLFRSKAIGDPDRNVVTPAGAHAQRSKMQIRKF